MCSKGYVVQSAKAKQNDEDDCVCEVVRIQGRGCEDTGTGHFTPPVTNQDNRTTTTWKDSKQCYGSSSTVQKD